MAPSCRRVNHSQARERDWQSELQASSSDPVTNAGSLVYLEIRLRDMRICPRGVIDR
jgi:hypothetical protein